MSGLIKDGKIVPWYVILEKPEIAQGRITLYLIKQMNEDELDHFRAITPRCMIRGPFWTRGDADTYLDNYTDTVLVNADQHIHDTEEDIKHRQLLMEGGDEE